MANEIGIPIDDIFRERAQWDPVFRVTMLPDAIDLLLSDDVRVGKIALHSCIYATIGYEKLGGLMGRTPEDIERMCHPDYDTSVNELFEIIGHLQRHEGVRLEVKVCSGDDGCEAVGQDAVGESVRQDAAGESVEAGQALEPVSPG